MFLYFNFCYEIDKYTKSKSNKVESPIIIFEETNVFYEELFLFTNEG